MCLAAPGKLVEWTRRDPPFDTALIEFDGVRRQVSMACLPEAEVGDYCLVHAGIAISRIDAEKAADLLKSLNELGLNDDDDDEIRG
ncbi:MAG: HypC/HybG/HupF family hydrogenase formation chaperone [Pirellulales bacterium]